MPGSTRRFADNVGICWTARQRLADLVAYDQDLKNTGPTAIADCAAAPTGFDFNWLAFLVNEFFWRRRSELLVKVLHASRWNP